MFNLENKKITILGAQRSGIAVADLIVKNKGIARISDTKSKKDISDNTLKKINNLGLEFEFGENSLDFIKDSDVIVLSPGVSIFSDPVLYAKEKGIFVIGEVEFAYQFCDKPVIAITGSNGKTTVSHLISELINASGKKSYLCGNIGIPFSQFVMAMDNVDYVVLEISSFQLESLLSKDFTMEQNSYKNRNELSVKYFQPYIACFLNFNQNHLDRHKDMAEYFYAKSKIFINQNADDYAVLNCSNNRIKNIISSLHSEIICFNEVNNNTEPDYNDPNYKVVTSVAEILNIPKETRQIVFNNFRGIEHRLEYVASAVDGIDFINDSKSTTIESCRWALEHMDKNVILICGGRDKNLDFNSIKTLIAKRVKKLIAIGEAKNKLFNTFNDIVDTRLCDSLNDAVSLAKKYADIGDCILFSPMCTSFDMFNNYEHRGKVFKSLVNNLIQYA